ncbi:MAG: hypothetical protein JXA92_14520, partial [candidate division Zixibacteria bacterium]|nr:hypothetical protein [candidate division Zixibacteria bacterium]
KKPFVTIRAVYAGGQPIANAVVTILPPGEKVDFQNARTDPHGIFVFMPDTVGIWKCLVDDETGHRGVKKITIEDNFFTKDTTAMDFSPEKSNLPVQNSASIPTWFKIVWGLSLIFGLTGIFYWFKARRPVRPKDS